jgi:hypothetical protein
MQDVRFRNSVSGMSSQPAHEFAAITHQITVKGSESTARECEFGSAVVRDKRIGMLQECDHDKPMVDPI